MVIIANEEFICLDVANDIKNAYEYGYELNLRIRQMTEEQENKFYYKKYNIDNKVIIKKDKFRWNSILIIKANFNSIFEDMCLGGKIIKRYEKKIGININDLKNYIFYV